MIILPAKCLRNWDDCVPFGQIAADDHLSFYCVGKNDGTNRQCEDDKYRHCFKNDVIDRFEDCDRRDLIDELSVIAQALSVIENGEET